MTDNQEKQYRLHIDIPLGTDEELAIEVAQIVMNDCFHDGIQWYVPRVNQFNYRLGHDEDRQKSNYLLKNENGHVCNKKTKVIVGSKCDDMDNNPNQEKFEWMM